MGKKKYLRQVTDLRALKPGDRVFVGSKYNKKYIGYVESQGDMGEGEVCVYVDTRWRSRRKLFEKWYADSNDDIPAGNKYKLLFSHSVTDVYVTNMSLNQCFRALKTYQYDATEFAIPF